MKEDVRDFYGKILGYREDKGNEIVATDFYGRILGKYNKSQNKTFDFYGRIVCTGDGTTGLIMSGSN